MRNPPSILQRATTSTVAKTSDAPNRNPVVPAQPAGLPSPRNRRRVPTAASAGFTNHTQGMRNTSLFPENVKSWDPKSSLASRGRNIAVQAVREFRHDVLARKAAIIIQVFHGVKDVMSISQS